MKFSALKCATLLALGLLTGCATAVYHPQKTESEMQADVNLCTSAANSKYWMDPIAALLNAYDCLEAKGYSRKNKDFARQVEKSALEVRRKENKTAPEPCRVPCRR